MDLIVERADRRIVAIEVTLSRAIGSAYRRADDIGVVPAALLGP